MYNTNIKVKTSKEFTDITEQIKEIVKDHAIDFVNGMVYLNVMHTTCGLKIMENEVLSFTDIDDYLERQVPIKGKYHHDKIFLREVPPDERINAYSHVRMLFFQSNIAIPIQGRKLMLGEWQRIILAEMDGAFPPRDRTIIVSIGC